MERCMTYLLNYSLFKTGAEKVPLDGRQDIE